jgi:mRNA interferase RelE/StbE
VTDESPYELRVTRSAEGQLARLPDRVASAIVEFMIGPLVENPHQLGGALHRELGGMRSARRGAYRIVDEVDEQRRTVVVHRIDHRSTVYRPR